MDTWVIWWLTGGPNGGVHVTDVSNASRTMLMNLQTLDWDVDNLKLMGIPRDAARHQAILGGLWHSGG